MSNLEIARALREMALFLEMDEVPFKPRAYEKAALAVEVFDHPLAELDAQDGIRALDRLPAVGKGIAEKIHELLGTGRIAALEKLRRRTPVDVLGLTAIEGLGPKGVRVLYDELGIRELRGLEKACRAQRVRALPHFGAKFRRRAMRAREDTPGDAQRARRVRRADAAVKKRSPLGVALPLAREIERQLHAVVGSTNASIVGSVRRRQETIGDLNFIAAARRSAPLLRAFASLPEVAQIHRRGHAQIRVCLQSGMDADLHVVPESSFGAALICFTGSAATTARCAASRADRSSS